MKKHFIKNYYDLARDKKYQDALDIIEAGYGAIDTEKVIKNNISFESGILKIKNREFNINDYENIYIVGCGKVVCKAALTLEKILKSHITEGVVIGINGGTCEIVKDYEGTHPLPSDTNFRATQNIMKVGHKATEKDLVIAIIGGGGSSLLCGSQEECDQGQKLYKAFLDSGGKIEELNIVRRHISELKGGGLAKALYPATVVGLIFSDVPGNDCSVVASGPTYKDNSTVEDAKKIIEKYGLGQLDLIETPKEDKYFEKVHNILLISNQDAVLAMMNKGKDLGYKAINAGCDLYNFPDEQVKKFLDLSENNSVVIGGGETSLVVDGESSGKGGRNDFLALFMADKIKENQIFVSMASDGHDNSDAAGGIVDGETLKKINELNIDLEKEKKNINSYEVLKKVGGLFFTGYIESNVSDLMFLLNFKED